MCATIALIRRHPAAAVLVPALRTVGNIVTGNDMQTQVIINCGALQSLLNLLMNNHKKSIKKESCWTISNITAGTKVWRVCCVCDTCSNVYVLVFALCFQGRCKKVLVISPKRAHQTLSCSVSLGVAL